MAEAEEEDGKRVDQPSTGMLLGKVILIAVLSALAATGVQLLLFGETNPAVTGAVSAAVAAVVVGPSMTKKPVDD